MSTTNHRPNGRLFVIEGSDGSGKGTQHQLLIDRLTAEGYSVEAVDFPRYDHGSSHFIRQYLNGRYGSAEDVGPYVASLFYALDRYEAAPQIKRALNEGKIVLANRFTSSNMAHQGTKFAAAAERRGFFIWLENLEYGMLGIPRPTQAFVLNVPAELAQQLVDQKTARSYTAKKRDIHEADLNHLKASVDVYNDLCRLFPRDFTSIACVRAGRLLNIEAVHQQLWQALEPHLPPRAAGLKGGPTYMQSSERDNPYIKKTDSGWEITTAGEQYLNEAVTNTQGSVYAFTDKLGAITIAAAMARLSRRGDDLRVTLLDEFAIGGQRDENLLKRVITAYGDDSVQQLVGQHVVVEGASNLLTKLIEWGRLSAYLEQSTRYIYFDQKDKDGQYKYFTPERLDEKTERTYKAAMDEIFAIYSRLARKLTDFVQKSSATPAAEQDAAWRAATRAQACDAVRPLLPVAAKSTVGIFASGQALEMMIIRLRASDSAEARQVGNQLLEESRKVMPAFLERADQPERGGATSDYLRRTRAAVADLARQHLPETHGDTAEPVRLLDYWPRNELDLVAHMLYEHSGMSLDEIERVVSGWPIARKQQVFQAYIGDRLNRRHKPGRALEVAHYSWDLVCDYGIFRDLQRHRMVDDLQWQPLTPRYGYDVPALIEQAGLSDEYEGGFDLSARLYSQLQANGYMYEAQYATLLGHRMRWKVTYNAREAFHLHELRTSPQGHPGYRKLVQHMHDRLAEVHPLIGAGMRFVNTGEDPALTRLAAERYAQAKLAGLA